jgi:hypothetical protein
MNAASATAAVIVLNAKPIVRSPAWSAMAAPFGRFFSEQKAKSMNWFHASPEKF